MALRTIIDASGASAACLTEIETIELYTGLELSRPMRDSVLLVTADQASLIVPEAGQIAQRRVASVEIIPQSLGTTWTYIGETIGFRRTVGVQAGAMDTATADALRAGLAPGDVIDLTDAITRQIRALPKRD
ncbi:aminopeptidase P family N-terminal domain-containing protein [Fontisubflavum oceani]|uniref:aminopeptidase P family N-terminal domain-containing protein n=1 Tax=Fontisubflavum oceani TaxID=2978973 RepID=UPI0025B43F44|nr:aminopeptidase P family N-terminal domain-containing protein [Fontisubflavum oceani]WJY21985.1 aminopeptidase P family N-terminal domain-containing protein [Fontisubflavum oceani]